MPINRKTRREISWILFFMFSIPLCYLLVFGDGGYLKLRHYQEELEALQIENMKLHKNQQDLLERIQKIKEDPNEIERIARELYNFARPGDVIVNVPESD
jgi:cell division protein FtsB